MDQDNNEQNNEVIVVTGSSGCLGHQVVKLLISEVSNVAEIRCFDLEEPSELMKKNIQDAQEKSKEKFNNRIKSIKWIQGDIRDLNEVEQLVNGSDCVIHCAAKIELWSEEEKRNLIDLESINVTGTENLLKAAIRFGTYKFIHVSSFEVYSGYETIYYATESTLPDTKWLLFGSSATTKIKAEQLIRKYSNNRLTKTIKKDKDSLNAVIVRFPTIYGEFDKHYVSKLIEITKLLGGKLQKMNNIWIRQQPIFVENAAWSLIKTNQRMSSDLSISGEEFHITDDTNIGDPFEFLKPYLECKGMTVTKKSYPFLPIWFLLYIFFALKRFLNSLDFLGIFTDKKSRLQEAIEIDELKSTNNSQTKLKRNQKPKHWYDYITPQTLAFMCVSSFLNRTKASLRLDYEPLVNYNESKRKSLIWYKDLLKV